MKTIFSFIFIIFSLSIYSQENNSITKSNINTLKNQIFDTAVDLTKYLPKGFSRYGDKDYTKYLQKGLDENKIIILPDFPILINYNGLKIRSNQNILFQINSKLIMQANGEKRYSILNLSGIENVKIYYPTLIGDKSSHLNEIGQWGMGIYILGCKNISIESAIIKSCWGDGICIGGLKGVNSKNILVNNSILDDNRRNGISIISGERITISNTAISNTKGHNPQAGIDIEPDNSNYKLQSILLKNIKTFNNGNFGLVISPGSIAGQNENNISIVVDGFKDDGSTTGLSIQVSRANQKSSFPPIKGYITVKNFKSINNKSAKFRNYSGKLHKVKLNVDFTGVNKSNNETIRLNRILQENSTFSVKQ